MAIETPTELRTHLQWALEVELSTIPPYLYALYAIEDQSSEAARLIRSVAVEEMLHVGLVANLITAVGGEPRLYDPDVLEPYPRRVPHHDPPLEIVLAEPDPSLVEEVFLPIERPAAVDAPPEDDEFETLGQFYHAIEEALARLDRQFPLFADERTGLGDAASTAYQLSNPGYYRPVAFDDSASGGLHPVEDLESADDAIETIVHQGEGLRDHRWADPDHRELTHYHKFKRLAEGEVPIGATRPVVSNPRVEDFPAALQPLARLSNAAYSYTVFLLERLFETRATELEEQLVEELYTVMTDVIPPVARALTARPVRPGGHRRAGPPFQFYDFDGSPGPREELAERVAEATATAPELDGVADAVDRLGE